MFRLSPRPNLAHTIEWRLWGKAAFTEAIHRDKPIFLVLSSCWCQWCHVLDETTLSEPSIISIINNDYIPIRVDSDLHPDINQRYNQNGWPSVALLSPAGETLWGGVYVTPQQMLYYLAHIRRYYKEHRHDIALQTVSLQHQRAHSGPLPSINYSNEHICTLLRNVPFAAEAVLGDLYDEEYGGFTIHPQLKFPYPDALELLLLLSRHNRSDLLSLVSSSLEQMRDGGLWDEEEGGFFRYAMHRDWSAPHTEKMLDENASMLRITVLLAQETQDPQWFTLAQQLIAYIRNTLWQPEAGIFSGSQCADTDYYEPGPYSRASTQSPPIDTTLYTSWNAHMISSYLFASHVLADASLRIDALRALDYLCQRMLHANGSVYHYATPNLVDVPGLLTDQIWMIRALLDAYALTETQAYLETAIALMHFACQSLLDPHNGLFYDYAYDPDAIGRLQIREQPLLENALAAECLLRMANYSKRQTLHDTALKVLIGCLEQYTRTGIQGSIYACVILQAMENGWL